MKKDVLTRPFAPEQVRTRPGQGGKSLSYVETHAVIARLNEAADFDWSFEVVKHEVLADEVIVLGKLTIDGDDQDGVRGEQRHARQLRQGGIARRTT